MKDFVLGLFCGMLLGLGGIELSIFLIHKGMREAIYLDWTVEQFEKFWFGSK